MLNGVLYHYTATNLSLALQPLNDYTDREAGLLRQTLNRRISILEAWFRGLRHAAYVYAKYGWSPPSGRFS